MSPVINRKPSPERWLHMPSLAVIALAGASVFIAHEGVSAWRARFVHDAEAQTQEIVGTAKIGR